MRRGVYKTEYGNEAFVSGPDATTAYDLDMGQTIPIDMVTERWIRGSIVRKALVAGDVIRQAEPSDEA